MIVVGLTGGMGQGKSTVGEILRQLAGVDYKADLEASYPITAVANDWMTQWPRPLTIPTGETVMDLANELIVKLPPVLERLTGKSVPGHALEIKDNQASLALNNRLIKYLDKWILLSDHERAVQLPIPINPDNKGLHRALLNWLGGVTVASVSPTIWSDLLDHRLKQLAERNYMLATVGGIRYDHDAAMIRRNGGIVLRVTRPNARTSSDVTETSMHSIEPDSQLLNDGTLEQLERLVAELWHDLQNSKAKLEYRAAV